MKWEITETKHLLLDGNYHISFDRLTEHNWFRHLSEKEWIDMPDLLLAFIAAYDAAGLKLSKDFLGVIRRRLWSVQRMTMLLRLMMLGIKSVMVISS